MILEMHEIVKEYTLGRTVSRVLNQVDLTVDEGEYLAIMGPSGSGKTTLMNILGFLDVQTSGEYLLNGESYAEASDSPECRRKEKCPEYRRTEKCPEYRRTVKCPECRRTEKDPPCPEVSEDTEGTGTVRPSPEFRIREEHRHHDRIDQSP